MHKQSGRQQGVRVEGLSKVTGSAVYVDDVRDDVVEGEMLHAVIVGSTRARGRIGHIDASHALLDPSVTYVITHETAPKLKGFFSVSMAETGERLPLQDDRVTYYGEAIAIVLAKSRLSAENAARHVTATYIDDEAPVSVNLSDAHQQGRLKSVKRAGIAPGSLERGDAVGLYSAADEQIDLTFVTAPHHHNAMETGAVIAEWDLDGGVSIRAATQWHHIDTMAVGRAFGLGLKDGFGAFLARKLFGASFNGKVRLTNHLAGGAFGRNLATPHLFLACMAAKVAGSAVRLNLPRSQTYSLMSYRSEVKQRLRIGATRDGKLRALIHDVDVGVGASGQYIEPVGGSPFELYSHEAHRLSTRVAKLDLNGTGWMRAPGAMSAAFAFESGLDELAHRTGIDPVELRLKNDTNIDPVSGKTYQQRALRQAFEEGALEFGWKDRPTGGSTTADGRLRGFGTATAFEHAFRFPASVGLRLHNTGKATVELTLSEMGQGAWTAIRDIAAEALGLDKGSIQLIHDRTDIPAGAGSVASTGTRSNIATLLLASNQIKTKLINHVVSDRQSPLFGLQSSEITIENGYLLAEGNRRESVADAMSRHPREELHHVATSGRDLGRSKMASASFGAVFAEVYVDPLLGTVHVNRLLGAFDCGQILQPKLVDAQLTGAMVWGLGTALMDETRLDRITGQWTNAEIGEALIPTIEDCPNVRAITVKDPTLSGAPMEMKGAAEVGLIAVAPAIANAVFDATGFRAKSLPIRAEDIVNHFAEAEQA